MNAKTVSLRDRLKRVDLQSYTMVFILILVVIMFQCIVPGGIFLSSRNLSNLFRQLSITGVITMSTMLMICSGNFDLAVGSIVALVGGIMAILQVQHGWSTPMVIMTGVASSIVVGLWQGFWVAYCRVPSYIVTLGNTLLLRGAYLTITKGITINPMHQDFEAIMVTYLPSWLGYVLGIIACVAAVFVVLNQRKNQIKYNLKADKMWMVITKIVIACALIITFVLSMNNYEGIPLSVMILVIVALAFQVITTKTRFARRVYAIGGNPEAAKLAGIDVRKHVCSLYVINAVMCALSAVLLTSRLNAAVAAAGTNYEMEAIPACVVGGTSLSGGKGTIIGACVGALLIACLVNGMSLLNISDYVQRMVKGLIMILAVWFDVANQKKK